jgi:hypothetical protein
MWVRLAVVNIVSNVDQEEIASISSSADVLLC